MAASISVNPQSKDLRLESWLRMTSLAGTLICIIAGFRISQGVGEFSDYPGLTFITSGQRGWLDFSLVARLIFQLCVIPSLVFVGCIASTRKPLSKRLILSLVLGTVTAFYVSAKMLLFIIGKADFDIELLSMLIVGTNYLILLLTVSYQLMGNKPTDAATTID